MLSSKMGFFQIPFPMVVIKPLLFLLLISPLMTWGQDAPFPKDTIYVKYSANQNGNRKIMDWKYQGEKGIYFSIKDSSHKAWKKDSIRFISLFYPYSQPTDTLSLKRITNYHFSNLKEIDQKRNEWIERKYKGHKIKPYNGSRNGVFQTYLIEVINDSQFVIYPVIWRNEGGGF